jgi:hypothetical protein
MAGFSSVFSAKTLRFGFIWSCFGNFCLLLLATFFAIWLIVLAHLVTVPRIIRELQLFRSFLAQRSWAGVLEAFSLVRIEPSVGGTGILGHRILLLW